VVPVITVCAYVGGIAIGSSQMSTVPPWISLQGVLSPLMSCLTPGQRADYLTLQKLVNLLGKLV